MAKEYTYLEEEPQMVREDIAVSYTPNGIADAIWTLILNQTLEVQTIIADRLDNLRRKSEVKPYSLEELNSRIDEAERQMECGEIMPGEQIHARMRNLVNSL